ncbi:MAG: cache domain-containing protein [Methanothrix sp.]|nr:cache domain-containing protein [Methanothrix sp.]
MREQTNMQKGLFYMAIIAALMLLAQAALAEDHCITAKWTVGSERAVPRSIAANSTADAAKEDAVSLLGEAVAYLRDNGIKEALSEFNDSSGPFVRGDLYIFAYDLNGTCIAHPIRPELVGQTGLLDINGVDVVHRELRLAERGGGSMYIVFPNPEHGGKDELKQIYIENTDDGLYLGSGYYLSTISASFSREKIDGLVDFVEEARQFARESGKQKSLEVFNDPKGKFTRDGSYIFAYDYEGRTLALPYQPELVGTIRIDAQDPNGVDYVRQIMNEAKDGSGFAYYIYPDPSQNMIPRLKLSYAVEVDDTWLLGSGIYSQDEEKTE